MGKKKLSPIEAPRSQLRARRGFPVPLEAPGKGLGVRVH